MMTPSTAVFEILVQRLAKSDLLLDRSQLDDLVHATVPLAHAAWFSSTRGGSGYSGGFGSRAWRSTAGGLTMPSSAWRTSGRDGVATSDSGVPLP